MITLFHYEMNIGVSEFESQFGGDILMAIKNNPCKLSEHFMILNGETFHPNEIVWRSRLKMDVYATINDRIVKLLSRIVDSYAKGLRSDLQRNIDFARSQYGIKINCDGAPPNPLASFYALHL